MCDCQSSQAARCSASAQMTLAAAALTAAWAATATATPTTSASAAWPAGTTTATRPLGAGRRACLADEVAGIEIDSFLHYAIFLKGISSDFSSNEIKTCAHDLPSTVPYRFKWSDKESLSQQPSSTLIAPMTAANKARDQTGQRRRKSNTPGNKNHRNILNDGSSINKALIVEL